jgi:hypothetical protein
MMIGNFVSDVLAVEQIADRLAVVDSLDRLAEQIADGDSLDFRAVVMF